MSVRDAEITDIERLMEIFLSAKGIMRACGNLNQWSDTYPDLGTVRHDIEEGVCKVLCDENGDITATMAFIPGPDHTYSMIHDGEWLNDEPYYVIHRIAASESGKNSARILLDWAFERLKDLSDNCGSPYSIRIDTHEDNVIMHHILEKYGFRRCGIIYLDNGNPRTAYIRSIKS